MKIILFQLIFILRNIHYVFAGSSNLIRIVGGQSTDIINHPYQVQIYIEEKYVCGGSILSNKFILSAAHCFESSNTPLLVTVRAGTTFRGKGGQLTSVKNVNSHSKFNSVTMDYDIAILELVTPLVYGATVAPVSLPPRSTAITDGKVGVVTGWGVTSNDKNSGLANQLQAVILPLMSTKSCQKSVYGSAITPRMFCAGNIGQDACSGDSGGPLIVPDGFQIGIVSWGVICGQVSTPGVYTHVKQFLPFINNITNNSVQLA